MLDNFKTEFKINQEIVNQKANEFAEKVLIQEIKDYYDGYNSDFRKEIREVLKKQSVSIHFQLPDILKTINDSIEKEHKSIIDSFIDITFISDMREALNIQPKEIKYSEFLKKVLEADHNYYDSDTHKYDISVEDEKDVIKIITITYQRQELSIRMQSFDKGKSFNFCYKPEKSYRNSQNSILNRIEAYVLSLVISNTKITEFDINEFDELFYNNYED